VLFELRYGAAKSGRPERNAQRIADFLAGPIEILPFEAADAEEAGDIRAALERAGTPIGPYDILVAAQARRHDAPSGDCERTRILPRASTEVRRLGDAGMSAICTTLLRSVDRRTQLVAAIDLQDLPLGFERRSRELLR
jgi:hypothetical protein